MRCKKNGPYIGKQEELIRNNVHETQFANVFRGMNNNTGLDDTVLNFNNTIFVSGYAFQSTSWKNNVELRISSAPFNAQVRYTILLFSPGVHARPYDFIQLAVLCDVKCEQRISHCFFFRRPLYVQ